MSFLSSPPLPEVALQGGGGGGGRERDPVAVTGEGESGEGTLLGINE